MVNRPLRGVNLGGWLVLEKWITPSLFKGSGAEDEFGLMESGFSPERLDKHRKSYVTESDFRWLQDNGVEAVRIPVGYWLFSESRKYQSGSQYLDFAFSMAEKYGLKVLVCLHGAPGSQNGKQHSGQKGVFFWYEEQNQAATLDVLKNISERYRDRKSLWGVELLNEPKVGSVLNFIKLRRWTNRTIKQLKLIYPNIRYVYSDAFMPPLWTKRGSAVLDIHNYHCFSEADKNRSLKEHVKKLGYLKKLYDLISRRQPTVIGEWSAALDRRSVQGIKRQESEQIFVTAQLEAYSSAEAWFYWTYKTENQGSWNFRSLIERGNIKLS